MQWFRWYHGACSDPKFGGIAKKAGQPKSVVIAIWAMCLESASEGDQRGVVTLAPEDIADTLDVEQTAVEAVISAMQDRGILSGMSVANWQKRQPSRDDSAERVRRYREKRVSNALPKRDVTPPDTDTDTDTPHRPPKGGAPDHPAFEEFWRVYPSRGAAANPRKPASEKFSRAVAKGAEPAAIIRGAVAYAAQCRALGIDRTEKVAQATTFLAQERWRDLLNVTPMEARAPPRRVPMHPGAGG